MTMQNSLKISAAEASVIKAAHQDDLKLILDKNVQAVIYAPESLPDWMAELAAAVESCAFQIPRVVLPNASYREIDDWLERCLSTSVLTIETRACLKQDILALVEQLKTITRASHFMLRIFTEAPTQECGFHVDTVPPAAPVCGILRVYNGAGTEYADPANVTRMGDFYKYLARRERLIRERREAQRDGVSTDGWDRQLTILDQERAFLLRRTDVCVVPSGSIVAFKHVDIQHHWSDHPKSMAWIHCSPMNGQPRLVINLTAQKISGSVRKATHVTAH